MRGGAPERRKAAPASPEVRIAKPVARGKPFPRGKANFASRFFALKRAAQKVRRAADELRWREKVGSGPSQAVQLTPRSKSEGLSARERARLAAERKTPSPARSDSAGGAGMKRKRTQQDAAAAVGVHWTTVGRQEKRARLAAAELTTPRTFRQGRKGGRPSLYSAEDLAMVAHAFDEDPDAGVKILREKLWNRKLNIPKTTFKSIMKKLKITKRAKVLYEEMDERLLHLHYGWIEAIQAEIERDPDFLDTLAYWDQTPMRRGCGHKTGYSSEPIFGDYSHKDGVMVGSLWLCMMRHKIVRAWMTNKGGGDATTYEWFSSKTPPSGWVHLFGEDGLLCELLAAEGRKLGKKMIIIGDRLGRAGSTKYNVSSHFGAFHKAQFNAAGVGIILLAAKGAFENPCEITNANIKLIAERTVSTDGTEDAKDQWGHIIRGPRSSEECQLFYAAAIKFINDNPSWLRQAFYRRAKGDAFLKRYETSFLAQAVRAERAAPGFVRTFNLSAVAFQLRFEAPGVTVYPHNAHAAHMYSRYFYHQAAHGLEAGLPPPFARPPDATEPNHEAKCRLCSVDTPKDPGATRPEDLLLCERDGCPGVYHWQCLRLRAPPARTVTWFCPTCKRNGQPLKLRKWSKTELAQASGNGAAAENLLAAADASSSGDASSGGEESSSSSDGEEPASPPAPAAPVRAGRGASRRK